MAKLAILRRVNGQLELDLTNLDKILEGINLNSDIPLAILSFIGKSEAGKTFYTNLLIQNLQNGSTGGWLSQVSGVKRGGLGQQLPGFPLKKDECGNGASIDTSEISLWAEAFQLENHGKKFAVLVLHANHYSGDERRETLDSLELFLALLSSRIVEIQWKKQEFRLLNIYHHLLENEKTVFERFLRKSSLVYLFRTNRKPRENTIVGKQAIDRLKKLVKSNEAGLGYLDDNVNIAYVDDRKESLLTSEGSLSLTTEMHKNLEAVINLIADDEEIFPKVISTTGEELTGGKLKKFMHTLVQLVNNITGERKEADANKAEMTDYNTDVPVKECSTVEEKSPIGGKTTLKAEIKNQETDKLKKNSVQSHQMKQPSHGEQTTDTKDTEKLSKPDQHTTAAANLQLVEFVVKQVEENILMQLKDWEPVDGSPVTNVNLPDFPKALEERLHIVLKSVFEKAHEMSESNRQWLITSCLNSLNNLGQELVNIQNLLQSFQGKITKIITAQGFFLPEEHPKLLENVKAVGKGILRQDVSLEYTMRACNWLVSRYKEENQSFLSSLEIISIGLEQIRNFYVEETKRMLKDGPYNSKTILKIHTGLLNECIFALITTLELPFDPESLIKFGNHKLSKQFSALKQANRKMLQVLQKRVNNLVAKAKEKYDQNDKLNNVLNSGKANRKQIAAFQNAHEQARAEAVQFLEERINRGEIRNQEPVTDHRLTLLAVIDGYWNDLLPQYIK